jgi:hypothetical protein
MAMNWRVWVLAAVLAAVSGGAARAQDGDGKERALAREIVILSGVEDRLNAMLGAEIPAIVADARRSGLSAEQAARYGALFAEEYRADVPNILELDAAAYADTFSEAELTEMKTFFAGPVGQSLRAHGPELTTIMTQAAMVMRARVAQRAYERLQSELHGDNRS